MPRIIWHRRGAEWVGRLTKDGPDRFVVEKTRVAEGPGWQVRDLTTGRVGVYDQLRLAKVCARMMLDPAT